MRDSLLSRSFVSATKLTIGENDEFGRDEPIRWVNGDCNFIFVENIVSAGDRNDILRLSMQVGFQLEYGITRHNNIIVWSYVAYCDQPHNAQEDFYIHYKICFLKELFAYDEDAFDSFKRLYLLFSEEWLNQWENKNKIKDIKNQMHFYAGKSQVLVNKTNVQIEAQSNKFNSYVLNVKNVGSSLYALELSNVLLNGVTNGDYSIAVKSNDCLLSLAKYNISEEVNRFYFSTGERPCDYEIKIYAGIAGETSGQTLSIGHLVLRLQQ